MPNTFHKTAIIKSNSLQVGVTVNETDLFCHFDCTGRFTRATGRGVTVRRGLDNRLLHISIEDESSRAEWFGRRRSYRDLSDDEKTSFFQEAYHEARRVLSLSSNHGGTDNQMDVWTSRLEAWTPDQLEADRPAFRKVYKPISILPPNEYKSLVVQFAEGCSYNECLFCDFYRDRKFHVKGSVELGHHLTGLKEFFGERLNDRTGIFLGDGNALVVSAERMIPAIAQIKSELGPVSSSFATFMDTFNLDRKSMEALVDVQRAGIDVVYVGLESGYNPLREFLLKPGSADEALTSIRTLERTGYKVGAIVMVGVGDRRFRNEHFEATVDLLQRAELTKDDTVFLSPFVNPNHDEYDNAIASGHLSPYETVEIEAEMIRWRNHLTHSLAAKVTGYYIREHIY